jgi:hypothetical protein
MGLLIRQGKQDLSKDIPDPIEEKGVVAQIVKLKLADATKFPDTLEVTFKLLTGNHVNRLVWDRVNYNPTSDFAWKYRQLRKAASCPYSETEGELIDIEALLMNKAVCLDLSVTVDTKTNKKYQRVGYAEMPASAITSPEDEEDIPFDMEDVNTETGEYTPPDLGSTDGWE